MSYLRYTALTCGPTSPSTIRVVAESAADWARSQVAAELRETFPEAEVTEGDQADLVVVVTDQVPTRSTFAPLKQPAPDVTVWLYRIDLGRVEVIAGRALSRWNRSQRITAQLESWGRRHKLRWALAGDLGRVVDRTVRPKRRIRSR